MAERTSRGNHWTEELVLAALWQLRESLDYFVDEFEPESSIEASLQEDGAGLVYQCNHFVCVFESAVLGLEELQENYQKDAPLPTVLRRLAKETEGDGDDHISCCDEGLGDDQVVDGQHDDHQPAEQAAGDGVVLRVCPWRASVN